MRKLTILFVLLYLFAGTLLAQVGINADGTPPDPSAGLDVKFTDKGLLPPRLTHAQMNTIASPANGLIVYCIDCSNTGTGAFAMFISGAWYIFAPTCLGPLFPSAGIHVPAPTQITWNWNSVSDATGYKWNTTNNYGSATDLGNFLTKTQTGLTCNTPYTCYVWAYNACGNSSATVLNQSTSLNPPATPAAGTHVPSPTQVVWNWNTVPGATGYKWNTTSSFATATDLATATTKTETGLTCNTAYTRYAWAYSTCGTSTPVTLTQTTSMNPPAAPVAGTHVPSPTQIIWNWNTVPGATGYKWNTTNSYATATEMATATTKTETGLTCNTAYTRYAWAYGACGNSTPVTLTQTTSLNPPAAPVAGTHVPSPTQVVWNWNTVSGATGYKWNTTNSYGTATDMATATTKTETGLTCNTAYTRYAWAYSACGTSTPVTLTQTTSLNPPATPVAGNHVPSPAQVVWNWNTVPGATGYKWNTTDNYSTATDMAAATTKTETDLTCNTSYTRYVWAYSSCGVSISAALTQTTSVCANPGVPCTGLPTVSYAGKTYNTVQIGTQCWFRENLDIGTRINGAVEQSNNGIIEKYCYNDLDANCVTYGGMYQWTEMMQYFPLVSQGLCPSGWHVPSEEEWNTLTAFLGSPDQGGKMKEAGYTHWISPNTGATNSSGFTALPSGLLYPNKQYSELTMDCYLWSSTNYGGSSLHKTLRYTTGGVETYSNDVSFGFSIRCLKDTCSSYSTVSVSVGVSGNPVCSGSQVTFTATPVNGGTAPYYQWKVNTVNAGSNSPTYTYAPVNGDVVKCVVASNKGCVSGNPATSNSITMAVSPNVTAGVSIAASANPVSSGTAVTFTATPVNGGSTPAYQWKVNGGNIGANSPVFIYVAANNDVITCVVTSSLSCVSGNPATSNAIAMQVSAPGAACPGNATVTYGSKTYNTVQIGTQCWFKENLNFGTRINAAGNQTNNSTFEKYCYNDLESNCDVYGGLYQWAELVQYLNGATNTTSWSPVPAGNVQGICPSGWHIPADAEWTQLAAFLQGEAAAGGKMKETGLNHWIDPNVATNSSGLTVLGCGHREPNGLCLSQWEYTNYWSSTENTGQAAWSRALGNWSEALWIDPNYDKSMGYSVRCVRNN